MLIPIVIAVQAFLFAVICLACGYALGKKASEKASDERMYRALRMAEHRRQCGGEWLNLGGGGPRS